MKPSLDSPAKLRRPVGLVPSQGKSWMNAADAAATHRSFVVRSQIVVVFKISPPMCSSMSSFSRGCIAIA